MLPAPPMIRARLSYGNIARLAPKRGYALLAALVLLAIVSLGATVAVERAQLAAQREREAELLFAGDQYRDALVRYYAMPAGQLSQQYPQTLQDLLEDRRTQATGRHLRRLYPDPMTGKPDWVLEWVGGRIVGVHSRSLRASQD